MAENQELHVKKVKWHEAREGPFSIFVRGSICIPKNSSAATKSAIAVRGGPGKLAKQYRRISRFGKDRYHNLAQVDRIVVQETDTVNRNIPYSRWHSSYATRCFNFDGRGDGSDEHTAVSTASVADLCEWPYIAHQMSDGILQRVIA